MEARKSRPLSIDCYIQELDLRPVAGEDEAFLGELYASTREDLRRPAADRAMINSLIVMQQKCQAIEYHNRYPEAEQWIIERDGKAIGRLVLDSTVNGIHIVDISLLPPERNRGFGHTVLTTLQRYASDRDQPLTLTVLKANQEAKRLYLALGFGVYDSDDIAEQMMWRDYRDGLIQSSG